MAYVYPNLAQYVEVKAINQLWVADIRIYAWDVSLSIWPSCWMSFATRCE